jgi:CRISPR/Cas system-associated exonuclease Cas4 (RecB family)
MISVSTQTQPTLKHGGPFDYLSPTRLSTWLTCPLRFKLRYLEGVEEPTSPSQFLGQRVHDALAYVYRHRQHGQHVTADEVGEYIVTTWDDAADEERMEFDSVEVEIALRKQAIGLVHAYLSQQCDEESPIAVEMPLECPLVDPITGEDLGIRLLGIVDLVLDSPLGATVIDFKTSSKSSAPLEVAHEIQLSCYAYVFRHTFGVTEHELQIRSLIKTKKPKIEVHPYPARGDTHFRRLFAAIRAYLDDVRSNQFVYRPNWTCSMCTFRNTKCRDWLG